MLNVNEYSSRLLVTRVITLLHDFQLRRTTNKEFTCTTFPLFCFFKVKNLNANSGYRSKHQLSVILSLVSEDFILLFKQQQTVLERDHRYCRKSILILHEQQK